MPTRGRPERPRSSSPDSEVAYGQGTKRGTQFGFGISLSGTKFTGFDFGIGVAERQVATFDFGIGAADQKLVQFGFGIGVMDWSGDTHTHDLFGFGIGVGESAGYAAPPRLAIPNALSLGQEVSRRGEPIPTVD